MSTYERAEWLFLIPSNRASLAQQMSVFNDSVERLIWVRSYGQRILLTVQFLQGESDQQEQVKSVLRTKFDFLNVAWQFVSPDVPANIRITFLPNQHSWSSIGTEAALVPAGDPTMNLADISQGTILHQFAHALGFPHENVYEPNLTWNRGVVNRAFAGPPHFWLREQDMQRNFYDLVNFNQFFNWQNFNPNSLMVPVWPPDFFDPPRAHSAPLPDDFDDEDKRFFTLYYPFGANSEQIVHPVAVPPSEEKTASVLILPPSLSCNIRARSRRQIVWLVLLSVVLLLSVWILARRF